MNYPNETRAGYFYATLTYLVWGLIPVYWKLLKTVSPFEIIIHRAFWSFFVFLALLSIKGQTKTLFTSLKYFRIFFAICTSAGLIGINWFIFVYGVNFDRILEVSLGYFIYPFVNILLGVVFLKEKLTLRMWIAIALVAIGVGQLAIPTHGVPWIAIILAISFGLYGFVRKIIPLDVLLTSNIESFLLAVPAGGYLLYSLFQQKPSHDHYPLNIMFLLILGGVITAFPLLWFSQAAKRLPLSTLGFFQYFGSTLQFLLAVLVYQEPFTKVHAIGFGFIWIALALYFFETNRKKAIGVRLQVSEIRD